MSKIEIFEGRKEFEEVKQLIKMVDDKLVHFSSEDEKLPDVEDHFIGDIF
mgnify:CR=1 FL=1